MRVSDPDVTQPNIVLPRCCIPGCGATEPGVGEETCVIWGGRRLCYPHFGDFYESPIAEVCSDRGGGPTNAEWEAFIAGIDNTTKETNRRRNA